MEKVAKQIVVNILLIGISILVIFVAQSVAGGKLLPWQEYLGDDFLLVLITSLGTTVGWRFSENIIGKWYYNILVVVLLFLLTLFYGIAMAIEMNEVLLLFIEIGTVAFILFFMYWKMLLL